MKLWWAISTGAAVVAVLGALAAYDVLVLGPHGASASETVKSYLFVGAVVAAAAATATAFVVLGPGAGTAFTAVILGSAVGIGVAVLLAAVTGNGPDEGDGFFWLTVASLVVSFTGAAAAVLAASRLRPD